MKTKIVMALLLLTPLSVWAYWLSYNPPEKTPPLPPASAIFTVALIPGTVPSSHLFTTETFMQTYSSLRPGRVNHNEGISRVWQNGVVVLTNKEVLFWRTCDKRFIMIDSTNGPYSYAIDDTIDLEK